jgi:hypothetical protein
MKPGYAAGVLQGRPGGSAGDATGSPSADRTRQVVVTDQMSRQHGDRARNLFILRDLRRTNGTWFRDEQVSERILQEGVRFRSEYQLVFKAGLHRHR